ncbi:MAG TPA: hypothetical protein VE999_07130 [Gemmataceae bacterium]|nr:hypothetical protein [Gemmataceae bacterium]
MRATTFLVLIGSLVLFQGACSSKKETPPPPLNKELLMGKWKFPTGTLFLLGYEFGSDGTLKMKVQGIKQPITCQYTWSGDRSVQVEYPKEAEVRQAYEAAAKTYKNKIEEDVKNSVMDAKIASGLINGLVETLPDKETFTVGISDPRYLVLVRSGTPMNLEKDD